jgi:hypothetical protein
MSALTLDESRNDLRQPVDRTHRVGLYKAPTCFDREVSAVTGMCVPAFRTARSIVPIFASILATVASLIARSVVSRQNGCALPAGQSAKRSVRSCPVRALTATIQPSSARRFVRARPIPLPAPVIQATIFFAQGGHFNVSLTGPPWQRRQTYSKIEPSCPAKRIFTQWRLSSYHTSVSRSPV